VRQRAEPRGFDRSLLALEGVSVASLILSLFVANAVVVVTKAERIRDSESRTTEIKPAADTVVAYQLYISRRLSYGS
jgi:hypothetical protein